MIKIQNFRAMMLSCHIGTISILTDKEYIDIDITMSSKKLLSERYYATDGKVLLYDLRSLVEQAMTADGSTVNIINFEAYVDTPDEQSEDYDRTSLYCMFCCRNLGIDDFEPLLKSHFLTSAASRRVAPESFVFLPFFTFNGELVNYEIYCDYISGGLHSHCWFAGPYQQMTASSDGVWTHTIFCEEIQRQAEDMAGAEIELTAFTVRVGDRATVDKELAKNEGKQVNVLIDSLGGNLATAFKNHGKVSVHFVGMNASAATIASLGAAHISIDKNAMYLVHKCSTALHNQGCDSAMPVQAQHCAQLALDFFEWGSLNADQFRTLIADCEKAAADLDKLDVNIASMYAGKCKKKTQCLLDLMKVGGWLSAKDALDWGFVDEITDLDDEPAPVLTDAVASELAAAGRYSAAN